MQDSRFPCIPGTCKLLPDFILQRFVFSICPQGISDPCAARTSHIVEQSQVPFLASFLYVNQHGSNFNRRHAIDIVVPGKQFVMYYKWLRITPGWWEIAKFVVQRPILIYLDLG